MTQANTAVYTDISVAQLVEQAIRRGEASWPPMARWWCVPDIVPAVPRLTAPSFRGPSTEAKIAWQRISRPFPATSSIPWGPCRGNSTAGQDFFVSHVRRLRRRALPAGQNDTWQNLFGRCLFIEPEPTTRRDEWQIQRPTRERAGA